MKKRMYLFLAAVIFHGSDLIQRCNRAFIIPSCDRKEMTLEKFEEKRTRASARTFYCSKEQKTFKMILLRLSLERAASEVKFLEEFFVSLDFSLLLSFDQAKESKATAIFSFQNHDF
jgi:hypothetical protein